MLEKFSQDCEQSESHGRSHSQAHAQDEAQAHAHNEATLNHISLASSPSTNFEIKNAIRENAPEWLIVTALEQKDGYGRQGRGWASPLGGLYMSVLLRPESHGKTRSELSTFALVVSVALRRAILKLGYQLSVEVKWPNDVLCEEGKLCGISVEAIDDGLCVGVGLNLFIPEEESQPSGKHEPAYLMSHLLRNDLPSKVSGGILLKSQTEFLDQTLRLVVNELSSAYKQWLLSGFTSFKGEYQENSALDKKHIKVLSLNGDILYEGSVCGIDDEGRLCLKDNQGEIKRVHSGEVHLV